MLKRNLITCYIDAIILTILSLLHCNELNTYSCERRSLNPCLKSYTLRLWLKIYSIYIIGINKIIVTVSFQQLAAFYIVSFQIPFKVISYITFAQDRFRQIFPQISSTVNLWLGEQCGLRIQQNVDQSNVKLKYHGGVADSIGDLCQFFVRFIQTNIWCISGKTYRPLSDLIIRISGRQLGKFNQYLERYVLYSLQP